MSPGRSGKGGAGLDSLLVWEALEVEPVRIEPRRLTARYTVRAGGKAESTELACRYGEDVFDPDDPGSVNLASMIAAQPALNYGLFCRRIVIHGDLDGTDRRFLEEMAENTAREIYTVKLLGENPFLTGEAASLAPEKRKRYCAARFEYPGGGIGKSAWSQRETRRDSCAVLSSGGKDSLLSFGLAGRPASTCIPSSSTSRGGTGSPRSTPTAISR